jgi:hypothetical protein
VCAGEIEAEFDENRGRANLHLQFLIPNPEPLIPQVKPQTPIPKPSVNHSLKILLAGEIEAEFDEAGFGRGLPGQGNSNSHGARPVHLIITMIKWIRTTRLSINSSLSLNAGEFEAGFDEARGPGSRKLAALIPNPYSLIPNP